MAAVERGSSSSETVDSTATVTVAGGAVLRAEPDEAVLWISLSALHDTPGRALSDVSARSSALVALLNEFRVDKADRSTTGITVYEEFDHTANGRRSLGHRAISSISVRLTDLDVVGRLISQATGNLDARIDGPRWVISPTNPIHLEAARQAAADARRKAEAYAQGAGAKLGRLIRLAEPDHQIGTRLVRAAARPMAAESVPIEPGEHEASATIQATFALEPD
jgi:uncharacterized protein YggE